MCDAEFGCVTKTDQGLDVEFMWNHCVRRLIAVSRTVYHKQEVVKIQCDDNLFLTPEIYTTNNI